MALAIEPYSSSWRWAKISHNIVKMNTTEINENAPVFYKYKNTLKMIMIRQNCSYPGYFELPPDRFHTPCTLKCFLFCRKKQRLLWLASLLLQHNAMIENDVVFGTVKNVNFEWYCLWKGVNIIRKYFWRVQTLQLTSLQMKFLTLIICVPAKS